MFSKARRVSNYGYGRKGAGWDRSACLPLQTVDLPTSKMEARVGIEPTHKAFAEPCLTTWLPRRQRDCKLMEFAHVASLCCATNSQFIGALTQEISARRSIAPIRDIASPNCASPARACPPQSCAHPLSPPEPTPPPCPSKKLHPR